jgi:hypothetical protein
MEPRYHDRTSKHTFESMPLPQITFSTTSELKLQRSLIELSAHVLFPLQVKKKFFRTV